MRKRHESKDDGLSVRDMRMATYNERMRTCTSLAGILDPAFAGRAENGWTPALFTAVQQRRTLAPQLTAVVNQPAVNSFDGFTAVGNSIRGLSAFSELWPSEVQQARQTLEARRVEVARAIIPGWQPELVGLPTSLDNAGRITRDLERVDSDARYGRRISLIVRVVRGMDS